MAFPILINDGKFGTRTNVGVTRAGQLVTAPIAYNEPYYRQINATNTAFNFVVPRYGFQFVIDSLIFSGDKNVNASNGAVITIYEASSPTNVAATKNIFNLDVARLSGRSIPNMNVITNPGVWINAKTDDATTNVTILGYYVKI